MQTQILQLTPHKTGTLNATIYVDYENIFSLLKKYGVNPLTINFFPIILDKLKDTYHLKILECIVYCNFDKKSFQDGHQSTLQKLGLQTRHAASIGKNCSDLMLTVDLLTSLYKNPHLDAFIIISSDRDIIPLLQTIKMENKLTYLISTKYGFNPVVSCYADYHEYIEDIFNLTEDMLVHIEEENIFYINFNPENLNDEDIENAREVARFLYNSNVWKKFEEDDSNPVTLKGYIGIISKKIGRKVPQILKDFESAHFLKYITIYKDENKGLCLKKGDKYTEVMKI